MNAYIIHCALYNIRSNLATYQWLVTRIEVTDRGFARIS